MSAAVLRRIAKPRITVAAMGLNRVLDIHSHALKTKHLCQRHNSALSPLDSEAGRLFGVIRGADAALASDEPILQPLTLVAGIDLERWLAKTLVMSFYARVTSIQKGTHHLPNVAVNSMVNAIEEPFGLWIRVRSDGSDTHAIRMQHSAKISLQAEGTRVIGTEVELGGVALTLRVAGSPNNLSETHVYRPSYVNFFSGQRVVSVALVWPNPGGGILWLSRGSQDAPLPTNAPAAAAAASRETPPK